MKKNKLIGVLGLLCAALAMLFATASPAAAGSGGNRCLWISAPGDGYIYSTQSCGTIGNYHIHYWAPGFDRNGTEYSYGGGRMYGKFPASLPNGTRVCAELWRNNGGGNFSSWGLPCITVG
ncbi:hypothetical protein ACF1G0_23085 [Streptomyces sp. NPDC013953]|uniref:hypothetical protein n=1 Tax=Streptomyces sp. NPDC013953 TaxID=3364868 RepID=UPI0036FD61CD